MKSLRAGRRPFIALAAEILTFSRSVHDQSDESDLDDGLAQLPPRPTLT
jgi:hypothetical protein